MRHGVPERQARSLIGRWRKGADERDVFDAFTAASKAGVTDPVAWITARLAVRSDSTVADIFRDIPRRTA